MHLRLHQISLGNGSTAFVSFGNWVNWQSGHLLKKIYILEAKFLSGNNSVTTDDDIREIREGILKSIFLSHCFFSLHLHLFKQTILCTPNLSFILLSKHKLKNLKASKLTASWINMSNPTLLKMKNTSCTFIPRLFAVVQKPDWYKSCHLFIISSTSEVGGGIKQRRKADVVSSSVRDPQCVLDENTSPPSHSLPISSCPKVHW